MKHIKLRQLIAILMLAAAAVAFITIVNLYQEPEVDPKDEDYIDPEDEKIIDQMNKDRLGS